jgi:site-specific DNA-methyltransferase (adenine-specific)
MKRIEDETIDLVFADYPFNVQDGKEDYGDFIESTAKEFFRILKDGGNLVIVNNPTNHFKYIKHFNMFTMRNKVALLRKGAFYPAWHFGFSHNDAYFLVKGKNMKSKWNGNRINHNKSEKDFIEYQNGNRTKAGWHPQAMPQSLVTQWVEFMSNEGDTVYDPFTGSGTTWIACGKKRNFIGSEYTEKYYNVSMKNYEASLE